MKVLTLKWYNALCLTMIIGVLTIILFTLAIQAQTKLVSVGWHGIASVGWVI
jgi:hypothetical protein